MIHNCCGGVTCPQIQGPSRTLVARDCRQMNQVQVISTDFKHAKYILFEMVLLFDNWPGDLFQSDLELMIENMVREITPSIPDDRTPTGSKLGKRLKWESSPRCMIELQMQQKISRRDVKQLMVLSDFYHLTSLPVQHEVSGHGTNSTWKLHRSPDSVLDLNINIHTVRHFGMNNEPHSCKMLQDFVCSCL